MEFTDRLKEAGFVVDADLDPGLNGKGALNLFAYCSGLILWAAEWFGLDLGGV
jgi:hypothetical protein